MSACDLSLNSGLNLHVVGSALSRLILGLSLVLIVACGDEYKEAPTVPANSGLVETAEILTNEQCPQGGIEVLSAAPKADRQTGERRGP